MNSWRYAVLGVALVIGFASVARGQGEKVGFNRDVRPILSDKCFYCHGPDEKKREADLRIDDRATAVKAGAIVPGKPDVSELIRRVLSDDPDVHMPPASAKLGSLTPSEVATLRRWIEQGAEYEDHWSFISLRPVAIDGATASERVDRVVQASLAKRGLRQQPAADKRTLVRRLAFDLTGLPPTVAEVESFVADDSPQAYEKLVDRLLASPQYGERMAVDWLDVARYADSYGFQVDREREMWPWRDWVIRAFNRNQPFDQFLTEQLAGDLLPNASDEQVLATAFNRLHQQEAEGGSVEEEYRVEYVCDRVQTIATTFLGLTFECARCHDHKYDPIKQREYYQIFSLFQNIDEAGLYSYFTMSPPTPTLMLVDQTKPAPWKDAAARVESLERETAELRTKLLGDPRIVGQPLAFEQLFAAGPLSNDGLPRSDRPRKELARFEFDSLEGGKFPNAIAADQPAQLRGENSLVEGKQGQAVRFTGDDPVDLPLGNFRRHEPFSLSLWIKTPDVKERAVVLHRSRAWTDAASRGYELLLEEGKLKWSLIHFWPGNAISIASREPLKPGEWEHVTVTYDGSSRADGLRMYRNGRLAVTEVVKDKLTKEITGGGGDNIALGERFRDRGFTGGMIDTLRVFQYSLTPLEALAAFDVEQAKQTLATANSANDATARGWLDEQRLAVLSPEWTAQQDALRKARGELFAIVDGVKELMVMRELPQPKKAYVLFRGEYNQRRDEVTGGTPAALPAMPKDAPQNRLGFAQWLTARNHPLTARVTVNRVWQSLWGRGLVKTAEDFGSQGARPLYPEALDTLALEFIDSGWDFKRLVKTIVMTQTYRQRSLADPQVMADDPENEWLARGPRHRLSAEMIRDNALAVAGLLKPQMFGPPVNPYEMSESFKPAAPSGGDGVHRRSVYTNWRRTGPPPAMAAFDAPRRAVCTAKRERTDTPLQSLILLNGIQYVEAARVLGERLFVDGGGEPAKMADLGFRRVLGRPPTAKETEIVAKLFAEQRQHFDSRPAQAEALLKIGVTARNAQIAAADAAAATVLAQVLLNHDECVVKR